MSDITDDEVTRTNISRINTGHDVCRNEDKALECRLQVTSTITNAKFLRVKFVEQTCTHRNKIVVLGNVKNMLGNMSMCVTDVVPAPSKEICCLYCQQRKS